MKTTLIDSPVANTANIARALRAAGADLEITADPQAIAAAGKLVLPGVGSFIAARRWLADNRVDEAIHRAITNRASLLGICVGHQLLFDASHEMGITRGLGILAGTVTMIEGALPVPQIGWNRLAYASGPDTLFTGIDPATPFYFVNSYAAREATAEVASAEYCGSFTAAVQQDRVFGVQFHPEKSSAAGVQVLRNFIQCN